MNRAITEGRASSSGTRRCAAALGCALLLGPAEARAVEAEPPRSSPVEPQPKVVVLGGDPALERALRMSLAPWKMQIQSAQAPSPGSSMPITAVRARVLSEQLGADALVWVSTSPDGAALWVNDSRTGNVTARSTPEPPFDVPTAAALALSVKTILRGSGPAPRASDAEPAGEAASEGQTRARQGLPEPAAPRLGAADEPSADDAAEPRPRREVELLALPDPSWQLLIHGGARLGALRPSEAGVRYGLQLRWAPWAQQTGAERGLWLGLDVETSTPWVVSRSEFQGEYWELAPGVCAGFTHRFARVLQVGLHVRGALHFVSLSGTFSGDGTRASASTQSPSLLVRPELGVTLGTVSFLVQPGAGTFLKRQAYDDLQTQVEVLETRPLWWMIGGAIALRVE